jgi:Xaa-Pro aminopeptidase
MPLSHPRLWTSLRSLRPLSRPRYFSVFGPRYTIDMGAVDTSERLSKLRQLMQQHKVDVYSMTSYLCRLGFKQVVLTSFV